MRKLTQKELREYISLGLAENITKTNFDDMVKLKDIAQLRATAYSSGVYGRNGVLIESALTGERYVIIGRVNILALF